MEQSLEVLVLVTRGWGKTIHLIPFVPLPQRTQGVCSIREGIMSEMQALILN